MHVHTASAPEWAQRQGGRGSPKGKVFVPEPFPTLETPPGRVYSPSTQPKTLERTAEPRMHVHTASLFEQSRAPLDNVHFGQKARSSPKRKVLVPAPLLTLQTPPGEVIVAGQAAEPQAEGIAEQALEAAQRSCKALLATDEFMLAHFLVLEVDAFDTCHVRIRQHINRMARWTVQDTT